MAGNVIYNRRPQRKRRRRSRHAFARGFTAFVIALALFLTAAYFNGDLKPRRAEQAAIELRPRLAIADEIAEALAPAPLEAEPAMARTSQARRRRASVVVSTGPAVAEETWEVLTAAELEAVSQAQRNLTIP